MIDLRIPSPCHEDWNAMSPDRHGRHCASCDRVVVDVAAMNGAEASVFLAGADAALARGERVCVHARLDTRGKVVVPSPSIARGRARLLTNALAAMLAMSISGCAGGSKASDGAAEGDGAGHDASVESVSGGGAKPLPRDGTPTPGHAHSDDDVVEGRITSMPGMLAPPSKAVTPAPDPLAPRADG